MAENGKAGLYWDGRRKFRGNRQRLFDQARQAVHPDKGTRYPCSLQNILSYRRRPEKSYKNPWSNEVATNKLVNFLNEPIKEGSKERAALYRLADGMQLEKWGPDLIIKAFDDLDLVFFRGVLATRTQISWMTTREIRAKGLTSSVFGFTEPLGHGRAHIVLNSTIIFLEDPNPFAQMWSTMLHEMVVSIAGFGQRRIMRTNLPPACLLRRTLRQYLPLANRRRHGQGVARRSWPLLPQGHYSGR